MSMSCAYCNKPLSLFKHTVTVCSGGQLYLCCSIGCRDFKGNHPAKPEASFNEAERAHWERQVRELRGRIEGNVRIYSSKDMTQEELRSLVPSLQDKAA
jgi:hypothetical protein